MRIFKINVKPAESRLDLFLVHKARDLSRSRIQKLIKEGFIKVNGQIVSTSYKLSKNDSIRLELPAPTHTTIKPEDLPMRVLYEDRDIIVIDKSAGIVVHPTADHTSGTVVNWLLHHVQNLSAEDLRPGIVHRLDKNTSGVLLIAKNKASSEELKKQFGERSVKKKYLALVFGKMQKPFGTIASKIGRDPRSFQKFAVTSDGKEAETDYRLLKEYQNYSLLEVYPKTGRTHQIRVHLSSIGYPIVGDKLYGGKPALSRPFLHAFSISFKHPVTGQIKTFESPLPDALQEFLDKLS